MIRVFSLLDVVSDQWLVWGIWLHLIGFSTKDSPVVLNLDSFLSALGAAWLSDPPSSPMRTLSCFLQFTMALELQQEAFFFSWN